jgi:hypothetical protein
MQPRLPCGLSLSVLLGLSLPAMGQDSRITGHITDGNQSAVATAVVTATQVDSGSRRQVLSTAQGFFQLGPLAPGSYRIDVVKPGFKPLSQSGVELAGHLAATVDLRLEIAEGFETITLEARQTDAGSLLAYICSLSTGCEMIEPVMVSSLTDSPFLP